MERRWDPIAIPHRTIKLDRYSHLRGRDIRGAQRAANRFVENHSRLKLKKVAEDGVAGPKTVDLVAHVAYLLGIGNQSSGSVSVYVQTLLRSPGLRNKTQRKRAISRQDALRRKVHVDVPPAPGGWHPDAVRIRYSGGRFTTGKPKIVWHTTEGSSLPSYAGSAPHITFDPKTGKIYQHMPLYEAAKALKHPPGTPETNNARAIQVELIAYSDANLARRQGHSDRAVENLTLADYKRIAELARWIEKHANVPRKSSVEFKVGARRLSPQEFVNYTGHLGHSHVPHNDHWDPAGLKIHLILK